MAKEIERKFLVNSLAWLTPDLVPDEIIQGYLSYASPRQSEVRVRAQNIAGNLRGTITVKSAGTLSRDENEVEISPMTALDLLSACSKGALIKKHRYKVPEEGGLVFEVDIYQGAHEGLIVAEIELPHEMAQFVYPDWLGKDVTEELPYKNSSLSRFGCPRKASVTPPSTS
jgi:adenylate cyclase